MIMETFVIERFDEGEFLLDEEVNTSQRLLNEIDLDVICKNHDSNMVFVRRYTDTANGYFVCSDNRWDYGTREEALKTIKRRI